MDELRVDLRSGDALVVCDAELRVLSWNEAAEELTGIPAAETVGRYSWQVLGAEDEAGAIACHAGCARARLLREGWPVPAQRVSIRARDGRRHVLLSTLALGIGDQLCYVHLLRPDEAQPARPAAGRPENPLTARQQEVLGLLAQGLPAKVISTRLGLTETTVRNHIRAILVRLGCHSQLEAVAVGHRLGLVEPAA
jgi:PAS domain S-box-containing protein